MQMRWRYDIFEIFLLKFDVFSRSIAADGCYTFGMVKIEKEDISY